MKPSLSKEFVLWFWENQEGKLEFFGEDCCSTTFETALWPRDGTLVGYILSKRYKKVSPHRKSPNLLYNLLKEKNKPSPEMVNKRGVPIGPTWLIRTLGTQVKTQ